MTSEAFIERLRVGGGKVQIEEESMLDAGTAQVSRAIADSLERLLPTPAVIHHGVQVSALQRDGRAWSGELEWLLLTGADVLRLRAKIGKNREGSTLDLQHEFYPTATLVRLAISEGHQEQGGASHLRETSCEMVFEGLTLKASGAYPASNPGPVGVTRFAQRVLDVRGRGRTA